MDRQLYIEELEERIAPTVIAAGGTLEFTDGDGDQIRVSYFGPDGSQADVLDALSGNIDNGDSIGSISVTGSDYTSVLLVENLGGGDGRTDILDYVESATADADFGIIALGVSGTGDDSGTVDLGAGAQILVDGNLGMLLVNGDVNFETATGNQVILAQGDIGLVEIRGNMILDPTNGARIIADSGAGDISFVDVGGDITVGQGGALLATTPVGAGYTVDDDAGDGTVGDLLVKVAGGTGDLTLVPIMDGGYVLSRLELSSGASATITALLAGGDVTHVFSAGSVGTVSVLGVADADLYHVSGTSIASVMNRSIGGDIVSVISAGDIGSIQTQRIANLGSAFTGTGNSHPLLLAPGLTEVDGVQAGGAISSIRAGGITNTDIVATSLGLLAAMPGGISGTGINISGSIGSVQAMIIEQSSIYAETGIGTVRLGSGGIVSSEITSRGTIGSVQTVGAITDSLISTKFVDGLGAVSGSNIGRIQAGSLFGSEISAFQGIASVQIRGAMVDSGVLARFNDTVLAQDVGGPIGSFMAGGMYASSVVALGDISTVSIGAGGMVQGAGIDTTGNILRASVRGDVSDSSIINATAGIGTLTINGDLAFDARISTGGTLGSLSIGGGIIGGDVIVAGDMLRFSTRGGISGVGVGIGVGGSVGSFMVTGGFFGAGPAVMDVDGNIDNFSVRGGVGRLSLTVGGSVRTMQAAAGGIVYTTIIDIDGDLGSARLRGTNSSITVGGAVGSVQLAGDVSAFAVNVAGATGSIGVGGAFTGLSLLNLDGDVGSISILGDLNNSTIAIGAEGVPANTGKLSVGGNISSASVTTYGNVLQLAARGSAVSSGFYLHGDVLQMTVGRGMYACYSRVYGQTGTFSITNAIHDSQTFFDDGVANYTVRGSLYGVDLGTTNYDGGGNPMGGAIGKISATDITNTNIFAYGGIGEISTRGTIFGAAIKAVGRDNNGTGAIVGGAAIGKISAKGLNDTDVLAYTDLGLMILGDEGIASTTSITTLTGHLGSITTRGLIYGDIEVAGNLTGSILSVGTDAVDLGTDVDLYFTDANGVITGGTLTVGGTIGGVVS